MLQFLLIGFLVLSGIQILYLLSYTIGIISYKRIESSKIEPVSVIICAFNELENLKRLIPRLLNQTHEVFEVIIVNDNSTDGTYEYLIGISQQHQNVKLVNIDYTPDHFTRKKFAITLGVKAAQYERLIFTDADCYPASEKWLTSICSQYDNSTEIVLGASLYQEQKGVLNHLIRFDTYWTAIKYLGSATFGIPYMGVGRNLSYSKSLFLKSKGFYSYQNTVGGDDDLFVNKHASRRNTKMAVGEESLTYSYPKTTWISFFIQKIRHLSAGTQYSNMHKMILGIYTLSNLGSWIAGIVCVMNFPFIVLCCYLAKVMVQYIMFSVVTAKLGHRYVPIALPLLDILFGICYITLALVALFTKRVRWS